VGRMIDLSSADFTTLVEVVPPSGGEAGPILERLASLVGLPIHGFSVASNPVAQPRMSALALCALIKMRTGMPAIMHCTTRDHNRLSAWSTLCGAKALGIDTVLVATGDYVALRDRSTVTTVRDVDVYDLVRMARDVGLQAGVVFDPSEEVGGMDRQIGRLCRKVDAGAQFIVTQPLYDGENAGLLAQSLADAPVPAFLGVLPLRSPRHAAFLHERVFGITIHEQVRQRMIAAENPAFEGIRNAIEMLVVARQLFAGALIMPPFGHYEIVTQMLVTARTTAAGTGRDRADLS
jgi:methylenetetrahydrofolate reductase (NADPH)